MSDDRTEELKRNILSPAAWFRIVFMIVYGVLCWLLTFVIAVIAVIQAIISLVTGRDNGDLRHIGDKIAEYFYQMIRFLVYASEDKPFFGNGESTAHNDADDVEYEKSYSTPANDSGPAPSHGGNRDDVFADMSFTDDDDDDEDDDDDDRNRPS